MAVAAFSVSDAELGTAMSLIVVDHDHDQYEVKAAGDAANYLAESWAATLAAIDVRDPVAYTPEVVVRAGEGRVLVINDDLSEENDVIEGLLADDDRPLVGPNAVTGALYLYAVISDTKAGRVAMVKKKNPTKRASGGKALFGAGDELRELKDDPWELDPLFDLVVSASGAYVLNTHFFEQLVADADRLRAKIGPWVDDISKPLPMNAESRALLVAACDASPRLRRRLRAIAHRGHLARVKLADVHRHVLAMGLEPNDFVASGSLIVSEDNVAELLRILNEDLTRGGLTGDPFVIESKEPR